MAALGAQSIASSYEQLLHVDADGGGNGTTHVSLKDGDNGTTFPLTLATDAVMVTSTNRLEFGDNASYIHQSADGVLDLVSDTEIELTATTIDINGAVDISGNITMADDTSIGIGDSDERIEFDGAGDISFLGCNVGIGDSSPDAHLDVEDTAVSTTASYTGIYSNHTKTAGATDTSDSLRGIRCLMEHNDGDAAFADLSGQYIVSYNNASGNTTTVQGSYVEAFQDASANTDNLYGAYVLANLDGGTVDSDVRGQYTYVDIDGGTLSSAVYGQRIDVDTTVNPSDKVFGLDIRLSGAGVDATGDLFFRCYDAQNSDTTAQITALAGIATFDGGDFEAAPDYAEYFESKSGSAIAIGSTVKLDGGKILACEEGDTPIGVVRPKQSSAVVCNAKTLRYHGKYLQTDYDEVQMEDYTIKKWEEEVDSDEYYSRHSEDEKYNKVEGSKAVLYKEGDELPEGKEVGDEKEAAVADTYFREHCYHSDKIPEGITAPGDAEILTPSHQRKKLNPDYDESQDYVKRADRDEWCLIGLLGQIPITKGQPMAGTWVKMKDVSSSVEMYFVK